MPYVIDGTEVSDWAMEVAAKRVGYSSRGHFERTTGRPDRETYAVALLAIAVEKFEPELKPEDPYLIAGNRLFQAYCLRGCNAPTTPQLFADELRALKAEGIL